MGSEADLSQSGQRSASVVESVFWSELAIANFSHGLRSRLIPARSTLRERGGIGILVRIGNCQFFPRAPKPAYPSQVNAPRARPKLKFGQNWQLPIFPTGSEAGLSQSGQRSANVVESVFWSELAIADFGRVLTTQPMLLRKPLLHYACRSTILFYSKTAIFISVRHFCLNFKTQNMTHLIIRSISSNYNFRRIQIQFGLEATDHKLTVSCAKTYIWMHHVLCFNFETAATNAAKNTFVPQSALLCCTLAQKCQQH